MSLQPESPTLSSLGIAAALFMLKGGRKRTHSNTLAGWSNCPAGHSTYVRTGQTIVVLEAMKMEHRLQSDNAGVVKSINTSAGAQVKTKQILAEIE